jgi:hypothetical protein
MLIATMCSLPLTICVLWALTTVNANEELLDVVGIIATTMGTAGTVLFFILFFRYQINTSPVSSRRWTLLGMHCAFIILMLMGLRWLGFLSPWATRELWGNYDIQTASRTWIIAVISMGSLTLLASLLDFFRQNSIKHDNHSTDVQ